MNVEAWQEILNAASKRGLSGLNRLLELGHKGMPCDGSILPNARLILGLEGTAHYEAQRAGQPGVFSLRQGAALFVAPDRWVRANPQQPYLVLGMVWETDALRLYVLEAKRIRSRWKTLHKMEFIIRLSLLEDARLLCRILATEDATETYYRKIAEALVELTRQGLYMPTAPAGGKALRTWQAAVRFVADHLHEPIGREQVAEYLRIHPNHLSRLCATFSEKTFAHYIQERRLERARLLLADPRLNVGEAATLSGFGSANHFIRLHRQQFGMTPGAARGLNLQSGRCLTQAATERDQDGKA